MRNEPIDVVGNAIASLVAVDALSRSGQTVRWFRPSGPLSGGFQTLQREGRSLELGMRLIELSYESGQAAAEASVEEAPPLAEYVPGPHGHRPYLGLVESMIRDLAGDDLFTVEEPSCWVRGVAGKDYVVVGDLIDLPQFTTSADRAQILAESERAVQEVGPHGLFASAELSDLMNRSFSDVSVRHCGQRLWSRLVEPLVDSIAGHHDVSAGLHRKVWMPLFHPQTVLEAARGDLQYRPDRPLYSIKDGGMGQILSRLEARVASSPLVSIVPTAPVSAVSKISGNGLAKTEFSFEDGTSLIAANPIVGVEPKALFAAAGISYEPDRAVTSIAWVDTEAGAEQTDVMPSVQWVVDDRIPVHRVTQNRGDLPNTDGGRTWIVEMRHDLPASDLDGEAINALEVLGLGTKGRSNVIASMQVPSFVLPSRSNAQSFDTASAELRDRELPMTIVGGARCFGVDSLNEQIVQGLQAAEIASANTAHTRSA